jgi:PRTRC genetic system ThiF family protein
MKFDHITHPSLLTRRIHVAVIGAGGTGSALLPRLMQLHSALLEIGHPEGLHVTVYDDDVVSEANIGRQCFYPNDVGQHKAALLINRLNTHWGTLWHSVTRRLLETDQLQDVDIAIGCVDSRQARSAILKCLQRSCSGKLYYIDSGNGESTGQVLLGEVFSSWTKGTRLPHIGDLFPDLVDVTQDATDDKPSCSVAEALEKQSLVINATMANEIANLLWILLRHGRLKYTGRFVNLETGNSVPIKVDTEVWAKMGYQTPLPGVKGKSKKS